MPDDATVVVVAGPKTDLLAPEIEALRAFLKRGGKVALLIDPPDKGAASDPAERHRACPRMGRRRRQRHRHRRERHRTADRHRRVGARRHAGATSDHGEFPRDDGLSAGAVGHAGRGRRRRARRAEGPRDEPAELGGNGSQGSLRHEPPGAQFDKGDKPGPISIAVAASAPAVEADAAGRQGATPPASTRRSPRHASSSSATATSRPTARSASRATARSS